MPTNIKILSASEINSFDLPPVLNATDRKYLFRFTKTINNVVKSFRTPRNKISFVLQLGYFKATNKFYSATDFKKSEIDFVCQDFGILPESISFDQYDDTTLRRHKKITLDLLGISSFTNKSRDLLLQEAISLCSGQMKPRAILESLVDLLITKKIEIPSYFLLANIITTALNQYEDTLLSTLREVISPQEKELLDGLLKNPKAKLKYASHQLTALKKESHSLRPMRIKGNIKDLIYFKKHFDKLAPIRGHLKLGIRTIQYYAGLVIKSTMFQMLKKDRDKYLALICFISHKYYSLNDLLIDVLIQSSQSAINAADRKHELQYYVERDKRQIYIKKNFKEAIDNVVLINNVRKIVLDESLSDKEKVQALKVLVVDQQEPAAISPSSIEETITKMESEYKKFKDDNYYDVLESTSLKLQNRVSEIIKHVAFNPNSNDKNILESIDHYKSHNGVIGNDAPMDFLKKEEIEILTSNPQKLRVSLYKVLLFHAVASAIKSGALNLLYSYKYRSFDEYLIPLLAWLQNKKSFLERAGLTEYADFNTVKRKLELLQKAAFERTNKNILEKKNPYVKFSPQDKLIVTTPPAKETESAEAQVSDLFPQDRFFSLFEVISTVNNEIPFLDCFVHWKTKKHFDRPDNKTFVAGIIALGCNLGTKRMARTSSSIKQKVLENTITWFFSEESLNNANNKILEVLDQLSLPLLFKENPNITHTSSDGQKYSVAGDSLNANYSYKYFGKSKGVAACTFNDERHLPFHSTVIPASERESGYVVDGLTKSKIIKSNSHSTDSHGSSEMNFGVMDLIGTAFTPRIKNFRDQRLFSFDARAELKKLGYKILPYRRVDLKSIEAEWDNILRFVATIKLEHSPASQLYHRLSHYSRAHPLYRAIRNYGKIIKTIFLLEYIDSVELRQAIEKQLNKTESINKFAKAIFFGGNQEFHQRTKEDQIIADSCKRLIENVIICWNYLYLSDLIYKTTNPEQRERLLKIIRNGSIVVWQHINLYGDYDFSDAVLKKSLNFSLPKLMGLDVT